MRVDEVHVDGADDNNTRLRPASRRATGAGGGEGFEGGVQVGVVGQEIRTGLGDAHGRMQARRDVRRCGRWRRWNIDRWR